jgi:hypothetical protein
MRESVKKRAETVRSIVETYYEPGRQDRSKKWVYLHHIKNQFYINERTFWRYLKTEKNH